MPLPHVAPVAWLFAVPEMGTYTASSFRGVSGEGGLFCFFSCFLDSYEHIFVTHTCNHFMLTLAGLLTDWLIAIWRWLTWATIIL